MEYLTENKRFIHSPQFAGLVTILCLLPFVNKAFHIDDTVFLWVARHLHDHPLNFYGFTANWYGTEMEIAVINQNPPLVSYYIALVTKICGWDEVPLHIAFLLPATGVTVGTYFLSRSLGGLPFIAALTTGLSPVFLVSSTNVMSDTMMVCFYVWALFFWVHGSNADSKTCFMISALLMALSALTKYFGMTAIPLAFAYTLFQSRRADMRLVFLLIPAAALAGYQGITGAVYGDGHLLKAFSYSLDQAMNNWAYLLAKNLSGLAFIGGGIASALFFTPLLWPRKIWLIGSSVLLATAATTLFMIGTVGSLVLRESHVTHWGKILQFAFFAAAGAQILILCLTDMWRNRNGASLLLLLWIMGTFSFATYFNWTTNGRTILPMVPAVGILVARRIKDSHGTFENPNHRRWLLPFLPGLFLALAVTWADLTLADVQRSAAQVIVEDLRQHARTRTAPGQAGNTAPKIWFMGHWGFQWYMEKAGAKALDFEKEDARFGDFLVVPINNTNIQQPPYPPFLFVKKYRFHSSRWVGTMQKQPVGAGFYATVWGPLPYVFGRIPAEEFWLFKVVPRKPA